MLSLMRIGMQPWREIYLYASRLYLATLCRSVEREGKGELFTDKKKKKTVGDTLSEGSIHRR